MTRVLVHVEGETEETFVNQQLAPHLGASGHGISARLIGNARLRANRGGIKSWEVVKKDIVRHLTQDSQSVATTMVDYYALPETWPGRTQSSGMPFDQKAKVIEAAIRNDLAQTMGPDFNSDRFIPYIVLHEFEGLLFSNCDGLAKGIGRPDLVPQLRAIRDQFNSPEEINDSSVTAPSKRILQLVPNYQKPLQGNIAAQEIGLDQIKAACPQFRCWLTKLESLPKPV